MFIEEGAQIVSKTYMTRVEGENTRFRHYLARLHRKTLCYSKSIEMLKCSLRLILHLLVCIEQFLYQLNSFQFQQRQ